MAGVVVTVEIIPRLLIHIWTLGAPLLSNFLAGFLQDCRRRSYPSLVTPQAFRALSDDQASMGVPPHKEATSPMGYCSVSYRWRPKSQHTADMYSKFPWPRFSVRKKRVRYRAEGYGEAWGRRRVCGPSLVFLAKNFPGRDKIERQ